MVSSKFLLTRYSPNLDLEALKVYDFFVHTLWFSYLDFFFFSEVFFFFSWFWVENASMQFPFSDPSIDAKHLRPP